ncbi:MAG: tRNA pseudouridine(55) synthase TruB [Clostridia bacterium]|nr:tRNA pseudouridine(55) synthase TruB [Clostridia bacterium]
MVGFICINKKVGDTSTYCVNMIKKHLKVKCGHMGTLDPLAGGVLPIAIGQATRLFDILLDKQKKYIAIFDFAYETPSYDLETKPNNYSQNIPTEEEIKSILSSLIGEVDQVPPNFSAKLIDGKRSYKLARRGVDFTLPPKRITIYDITLLERVSDTAFKFLITCSGGTYIRSIVRDMAKALNCYGTMIGLERISSGEFNIENSVTIEELLASSDYTKFVIRPQDALTFEEINLDKILSKRLIDGVLCHVDREDGTYKVFSQNEFWGVGVVKDKSLKMKVYVRDL